MKHIKILTLWILISLVIQFAGLFYANNYLFANKVGDVKIKKVVAEDVNKKNKVDDSVKKVDIPQDAKNMKVSYDGKYITYTKNNGIFTLNLDTGDENKINKVSVEDGAYFWLSDRNRMLIQTKEDSTLFINHYDSDKKDMVKDLEIDMADSSGKIVDIVASPINQMKYFKVSYGNNRTSIYASNIMNDVNKLSLKTTKVGNIECINRKDTLLYEDKASNKINVTNSSVSYSSKDGYKVSLLKVDSEDIVYIAEYDDNGKVKKLSYGSIDDNFSSWKKLDVLEDITVKDIFITNKSDIFFNNNLKGEVKSIISGKSYKYEGKLLDIVEGYIVSTNESQLIKTKIK